MRPVQPTTTQPTNRMGRRPGMMAVRRNAGPSPMTSTPVPGYKKGGKVKGYKNGGCVMGKRGGRNTKML